MRENRTKGIICLDDEYSFTYVISEIEYIEREDESFTYIFRPNYSVIDLLGPGLFQGIPGLDLDLRREEYVRDNLIPVFISERSPQKNREDLIELLEAVGLDYWNPLEWLIRTDTRYSGDKLYVKRYEPIGQAFEIESVGILGTRSGIVCRQLLEHICKGDVFVSSEICINDDNRQEIYKLLITLYAKDKKYIDERRRSGIAAATANGKYKGRTRTKLDSLKLAETISDYTSGKLTGDEASAIMGVSRSTFLRRVREGKKEGIN